MSLKAFQTVSFSDRALVRFQENVVAFLAQLMGVEVIDAFVVESVHLTVGSNTVAHLLGRAPTRMVVTSQTATSAIWWSKGESLRPAETAIIHSSAVCTADLYFFGG